MAEHRIVVPGVVGSTPIIHPIKIKINRIDIGRSMRFSFYLQDSDTSRVDRWQRQRISSSCEHPFDDLCYPLRKLHAEEGQHDAAFVGIADLAAGSLQTFESFRVGKTVDILECA